MRFAEMNLKNNKKHLVSDFEKKTQYIEYPEEMIEGSKPDSIAFKEVMQNKSMREKFFEGVSYEKDPVESSDE